MPRTSQLPAEICPNNHILSIPTDGRWAWDEKARGLVYESGNERDQNQERHSNEIPKIDVRTGRTHHRKQYRPLQHIIKTKDSNKITLSDVIQAALNVMSEMFYISIEFEEYLRMSPVHEFLLHLLNYFYWFFQTMDNAVPRPGQHIDRSEVEKSRIRTAYAHLLAALRELACKYAVLLLGIDLKDFHHMRNGDLFYSCTELDRTIFESLFIFSTYFTWITFYRQHFGLIRKELARLFRASGDTEIPQIPGLEDRVNNNVFHGSMTRHKSIDFTAFFSRMRAKREIDSTQRTKNISNESNSLIKQSRNKNQVPARDSSAELSKLQDLHHRMLTEQLQNLTDKQHARSKSRLRERTQKNRERLLMQRLLAASFQNNLSILPTPMNPLDESGKTKEHPSILPQIQFRLLDHLGILGKPYSDFDLMRLTLKPTINDDITIPTELLITLSPQT